MEQPIVTTRLAFWIKSGVRVFGRLDEMSPTFSHRVYHGRVDPRRGYCAGALRVHPMFLGKGLGRLASSRVLNTYNSTGPLTNLGSLEEPVDKSGN